MTASPFADLGNVLGVGGALGKNVASMVNPNPQ